MKFKIKIIIYLVILGLIKVSYSQQNNILEDNVPKFWSIGDVLSKEPTHYGACNFVSEGRYYRKFLGVTDNGFYLVQDFYTYNDQPSTDPYVVIDRDSLISTSFESPVEMAIHGKYIVKNFDGIKTLEGNFIHGKAEGMWVEYDSRGNIISTVSYVDGLLDGIWKKWDSDGNLVEFGQYDKGLKIGSWEEYGSQGNVISSTPYVNGKKHGCATIFDGYSIDSYRQEIKFEAGELKGRRTWNRYGLKNTKWSSGQACD